MKWGVFPSNGCASWARKGKVTREPALKKVYDKNDPHSISFGPNRWRKQKRPGPFHKPARTSIFRCKTFCTHMDAIVISTTLYRPTAAYVVESGGPPVLGEFEVVFGRIMIQDTGAFTVLLCFDVGISSRIITSFIPCCVLVAKVSRHSIGHIVKQTPIKYWQFFCLATSKGGVWKACMFFITRPHDQTCELVSVADPIDPRNVNRVLNCFACWASCRSVTRVRVFLIAEVWVCEQSWKSSIELFPYWASCWFVERKRAFVNPEVWICEQSWKPSIELFCVLSIMQVCGS